MGGWDKAPEYGGAGPLDWGRVAIAVVILTVSLGLFFVGQRMQQAAIPERHLCNDGTPNTAFGRPGACSHHGGVKPPDATRH